MNKLLTTLSQSKVTWTEVATVERLLSVDAAKAELKARGYVRPSTVGLYRNKRGTLRWKFISAEVVNIEGRDYVLCRFAKLVSNVETEPRKRFRSGARIGRSAANREALKAARKAAALRTMFQLMAGYLEAVASKAQKEAKLERALELRQLRKRRRAERIRNKILEVTSFLKKRAQLSQMFWWQLTALASRAGKKINNLFKIVEKVVNGKTVRTLKLTVEPYQLGWDAGTYRALEAFAEGFNEALNAGLIKGWLRNKFQSEMAGNLVIFA